MTQARSARLRSCLANHRDLFEDIISEACNDVQDSGGLKIAVTGSCGGKLGPYGSRNPRYAIGSGSKEAWNKLADSLEAKVAEHLKSNLHFCPGGCLFCGRFDRLLVKVKDQDGNVKCFKIRPRAQLQKLIDAYCALKNLAADKVNFLFKGNELSGVHTAESLRMEDDDVIDAKRLDKQEEEEEEEEEPVADVPTLARLGCPLSPSEGDRGWTRAGPLPPTPSPPRPTSVPPRAAALAA